MKRSRSKSGDDEKRSPKRRGSATTNQPATRNRQQDKSRSRFTLRAGNRSASDFNERTEANKHSAFPGNQTFASQQTARGRQLNNQDYTIGWICALPKEAIPAILLFDERHKALKSQPNDENLYYLGCMGGHNIVIAHLPQGTYGEASAAAVVINMVRSFPSIRFCLMVGIGAGVPNGEEADIRLGDVVVSQPGGTLSGVVEYDFGTEHADGSFQRKGNLSRPPNVLLTALGQREAHDTIEQGQLQSFIARVHGKRIKNPEQLRSPGPSQDYLFPPEYHCQSRANNCQDCDKSLAVHRPERSGLYPDPIVHYGIIASGMKLVRDPILRDKLRDDYSASCIEMEAAGLMNNFPCLVIRGICDYADSHKNDRWQGYAALTASAYARELLQFILPVEVQNTTPANELLDSVLQRIDERFDEHDIENYKDRRINEFLRGANQNIDNKRHEAISERVQPGTWMWVLKRQELQEWRNLTSKPAVLCCIGEPGVGKSCMMSVIIEALTPPNEQSKVGLAYTYCSYQDRDQTATSMYRIWTAQLLRRLNQLPDSFESFCTDFSKPEQALKSVCEEFDRVYICIDGLDELNDEQRQKMLQYLLQPETGLPRNAQFLLTGRQYIWRVVQNIVKQAIKFDVRANDEDIIKHLEQRIKSDYRSDPLSEVLKANISQRIVERSAGNFLFADGLVSFVLLGAAPNEVKKRLAGIPSTLDGVFSEMIERALQGRRPDLARKILTWTFLAERPLTGKELQFALAAEQKLLTEIDLGTSFSVAEREVNSGDLVSHEVFEHTCLGLVVVDRSDSTVRLFHQSFRDFLNAAASEDLRKKVIDKGAHDRIWQLCLKTLRSSSLVSNSRSIARSMVNENAGDLHIPKIGDNGHDQYASSYWGRHLRKPGQYENPVNLHIPKTGNSGMFDQYASSYWGHHLRKSGQSEKSVNDATSYLQRDISKRYLSQWYLCANITERYRPKTMTEDFVLSFSPMHVAAYFGLDRVLASLLSQTQCKLDINAVDGFNATALHWAAGEGYLKAVGCLLESGADPTIQETGFGTPLTRALDWGHFTATVGTKSEKTNAHGRLDGIIQTLLARVPFLNYYYITRDSRPLIYDRRSIPYFFEGKDGSFEYGRSVGKYQTPLMRAVEMECVSVVKQILKCGADINAPSETSWTALHWAAHKSSIQIVKLLIKHGADANIKDIQGWTPLQVASLHDNQKVTQYLQRETTAVCSEHDKQELRSSGAVESIMSNSSGFAPPASLISAVKLGYIEMTRILLNRGECVDPDLGDSSERTSLSWAAQFGHTKILKLLHEHGANLESRDNDGRTPLSWGAEGGHKKTVKALLEFGAEVNSCDSCNHTPLFWSARSRKVTVVELLLKRGACQTEPEKVRLDQKLLKWSAAAGSIDIMNIVLKRHADTDLKDFGDCKALMRAAALGQEESVRLLLRAGLNLDSIDNDGQTPLVWAARSGSKAIVKIVHERKPELLHVKDKLHRTALMWAAGRGHLSVVKYLLKHGVDPFSPDKGGVTALAWAAAAGHEKIVKVLLKMGADPNYKDKNGQTPISLAAQGGNRSILLIRPKGSVGSQISSSSNPSLPVRVGHSGDISILQNLSGGGLTCRDFNGLSWSISHGCEKVVKRLLAKGAQFNTLSQNGRSPLSFASEQGNVKIIRHLLLTTNATATDRSKPTLLFWATKQPSRLVVEMILDGLYGLVLDEPDHKGRTPLSWAAEEGHLEVVEVFLERKADFNLQDGSGRTPLSWATQKGHALIVKLLIRNGADTESVDDSGRVLLSWAAESGDYETFEIILKLQEDKIEAKDKTGRTPLSWVGAARVPHGVYQGGTNPALDELSIVSRWDKGSGDARIVEKMAAMTDIDALDNSGRTPLSWAASNGYAGVVRALLGIGAEIDSRDCDGRTPLSWALDEAPRMAVIKILLDEGADPESKDIQGQTLRTWLIADLDFDNQLTLPVITATTGWRISLSTGVAFAKETATTAMNCASNASIMATDAPVNIII